MTSMNVSVDSTDYISTLQEFSSVFRGVAEGLANLAYDPAFGHARDPLLALSVEAEVLSKTLNKVANFHASKAAGNVAQGVNPQVVQNTQATPAMDDEERQGDAQSTAPTFK